MMKGGNGVETRNAAKNESIKHLIMQNPVDMKKLREIALSPGGILSNDLRQLVWPKLLGLNRFEVSDYRRYVTRNRWSDQIRRDVDRSMWHIENIGKSKKRRRGNRRKLLADMLNALMSKYPDLQYYQGLHDILSVLVLVLTDDERLCFAVAERLALFYLKDNMRPDFKIVMAIIELLFPLLRHVDPQLAQYLEKSGVHCFFALSWIITFFAHDIHDLSLMARLFDAFLASCPLFPLYMSAALVVHWRKEIMELECDFSVIHAFLSHLPTYGPHGLPVEQIIARAQKIQKSMPPLKLIKHSAANNDLVDLVAKGLVCTFQSPPGLLAMHMKADWYLMEERRRHEGLSVRCKMTRNRRRKAFLAGSKMPSPSLRSQNGQKSLPGGTKRRRDKKRDDDHDFGQPARGSSSMTLKAAAIVGIGAVAISVTCLWGKSNGFLDLPLPVGQSFVATDMMNSLGRKATH